MPRALFIAAPASGQGKTLLTAALAWRHRQQGKRVRVFKTGPDFLDPMMLEAASGAAVGNLDLFMGGAEDCLRQIASAADADLILVEGVMGLYDGTPSSADMAVLLNMPLLLIVDASAMAQTFGALALGLTHYDPRPMFAGILANRVASQGHAAMLRNSLPASVAWLGHLPHEAGNAWPERHLGLIPPAEAPGFETHLQRIADALPDTLTSLDRIPTYPLPSPPPQAAPIKRRLDGLRIAVARDSAFSFIYPANTAMLNQLGAELRFFSLLAGDPLPDCEAIWLPGGYPELHLQSLSQHPSWRESLLNHHRQGKPLLAECGGMVALTDKLTTATGDWGPMAGLIPGESMVCPTLQGLGLQTLETPWGLIRGHAFHYSRMTTSWTACAHTRTQRHTPGEAVYRSGGLVASYFHSYFPSNPEAIASLFLGQWT